MRNSETGEYELVMGNRQLLSGFFIVALLFGVAFAMGYIVGRNSTPTTKVQADTSAQSTQPVEPRPTPGGSVVPTSPAPEPVKTESAPTETATRPVETTPVSAEQPAAEKPSDPSAPASDMPSGNYWQVIAAKQSEAEAVQKALREKVFPAHLTPGPNGLVRVIVGPYGDREALGKAKADLENAGFRPHLIKR